MPIVNYPLSIEPDFIPNVDATHYIEGVDNMQINDQSGMVYGRGPVRELLRSGRQIESLVLQKGLDSGPVGGLIALAKEQGVPIKQMDARKLEELCEGGNHQGVAAFTSAARYVGVEDILERAQQLGVPPFIIIADKIEDPHNLGAIIRTAEAAGAHGLILPKRHSAGLGGTVAKTSAGAAMHLPVARVSNIPTAIDDLKKRGVWVYGADMGGQIYDKTDFSGPAALVVGSEGNGLSRLVREKCDILVSLPMYGKMDSLNVSVASGILLYEMARQRQLTVDSCQSAVQLLFQDL